MRDPYAILGVSRTATADEIKRAYRKLAKELHPDLHPNKKDIEERFKEVSAAYSLLADADTRRRYDAGEIDASGAEKAAQRFYRTYRQGAGGSGGTADFPDLSDIFASFFGGQAQANAGRAQGARAPRRGADARYELPVTLLDVANGAQREVTLPNGQTLRVALPEGIEDGQTIRLAGKGNPGTGGAPPGDALVTVRVAEHPWFTRSGADIALDLPITIAEAVNGGSVTVPTVSGPVTIAIPANASSGKRLRLKDKGLLDRKTGKRGHQFVMLKIVLPDKADPDLARAIEEWSKDHRYDPRRHLPW